MSIHGKVILVLTLEVRFGFFMMDLSPNNQIEDRKPILTADGLVQTSNSPFEPTISQETQTSNGIGGQLTVDQLDIEILPIIYDIVRWWVGKTDFGALEPVRIMPRNQKIGTMRQQVRTQNTTLYNQVSLCFSAWRRILSRTP